MTTMNDVPTPDSAVTVLWTRFLALTVAAMLGWKLALSLIRLPSLSSVSSSQCLSGGVLLSMLSMVVTNRRVKVVLAVGGVILAAAGPVLRLP